MQFNIRSIEDRDRGPLGAFLAVRWGSERIVAHGTEYQAAQLPGWVAEHAECLTGALTFHREDGELEVVTLDSATERHGMGTALLEAAVEEARRAGCARVWLVTTNDNLGAMRFYQRRGFTLAAIHAGAVEEARRTKPEIPRVGQYGIPIRDEIELELKLA